MGDNYSGSNIDFGSHDTGSDSPYLGVLVNISHGMYILSMSSVYAAY